MKSIKAQLLLAAILVSVAATIGWMAGSNRNRFELVRVGPASSWIARLDRQTGKTELYDRTQARWLPITEANPFDQFGALPNGWTFADTTPAKHTSGPD